MLKFRKQYDKYYYFKGHYNNHYYYNSESIEKYIEHRLKWESNNRYGTLVHISNF